MTQKIIIVKTPVLNTIERGCYDEEVFRKHYPYLDYSNREFFDFQEVTFLEIGTVVFWCKEKYYITKVIEDSFGTSKPTRLTAKLEYVPRYRISKRMQDKKGNTSWIVSENDLNVPNPYWFVNSEGSICSTWSGKNPKADEWRKKIGNYFYTKEHAQKYQTWLVRNKYIALT